jgi:hypothetical protein
LDVACGSIVVAVPRANDTYLLWHGVCVHDLPSSFFGVPVVGSVVIRVRPSTAGVSSLEGGISVPGISMVFVFVVCCSIHLACARCVRVRVCCVNTWTILLPGTGS